MRYVSCSCRLSGPTLDRCTFADILPLPLPPKEPEGEALQALLDAGGSTPEPVVIAPQEYKPYFPLNTKGLVCARFVWSRSFTTGNNATFFRNGLLTVSPPPFLYFQRFEDCDKTTPFSISDTASFGLKQDVGDGKPRIINVAIRSEKVCRPFCVIAGRCTLSAMEPFC